MKRGLSSRRTLDQEDMVFTNASFRLRLHSTGESLAVRSGQLPIVPRAKRWKLQCTTCWDVNKEFFCTFLADLPNAGCPALGWHSGSDAAPISERANRISERQFGHPARPF